jgi:hypothetical protein
MMDLQATVDTKAFITALKTALTGARAGQKASVRFDFAKGSLAIEGPGAGCDIDVACNSRGTVLVSADPLRRWTSVAPKEPTINLRSDGVHFWIGGTALQVGGAMDIAPKVVAIPIGASHADVLRAMEREGELVVFATLGGPAIAEARKHMERAIGNAVHALKDFGVTTSDIEKVVLKALRPVR